jgi:adenine-specific DNA-methyltransferase
MKTRTTNIEAARQIIISLGLPRAQQNERSALCLLALLNLTPGKAWADAENPLVGITPIMDWAREHYDKDYAPNTRETSAARPCTSFAMLAWPSTTRTSPTAR